MSSPKGAILLLGGTGKVASRITPLLSSAGYTTLIASRSGTSPALPNTTGVKVDWDAPSSYPALFTSAQITAIFLVGPPVIDMYTPMKALIDMALQNGVRRFVLLSASLLDVGDGPAMGKVSKYISELGVEWAVLRPSWFMGIEFLRTPTRPHNPRRITDHHATGSGKVPFVAVADIAAVAFHALTDSEPHNTDHLILGPELFSYSEVAELMSEKLGREIKHVDISERELAEGMKGFGIPGDYADMLAQLDTAIREGKEERLNGTVK
ncbi:Agroclavine dehydrogenase, partial [Lachnellula suecica]